MAMSQKEKTNYKREYNEKMYERVGLYLYHGVKNEWKSEAEKKKMSLNEFINYCVNEQISKNNRDEESYYKDLISRKELLERIEFRIKANRHDSNSGAKRKADWYECEIKPLVEGIDSVDIQRENE